MHSESEGSPKVQKVPFRISGRGSKQLSKAMEQTIERGHYSNEISWVFSTGNHPCFAKVVSMTTGGVMIQPMSPIDGDSDIYQPWEGHLWMEKRENIFPVEMKQELRGWKVCYTPSLKKLIDSPQLNPQKLLSPPSVRSDHQRSNDDDKISDIVVLSEVSANETHSLKSNELVEEDFEIACRKSPSPPQELSQGGAGPIDLTTLDSEETSNIKRNVYFESSSAEDRKSKKRVHKISLNAEFDHCNSNDETVVSKRIRNATRLHV